MKIREVIRPSHNVADVMRDRLVTVGPDTPANDAFALMQRERIRHLLVVVNEKTLVGIVSDRDFRNVAIMFDKRPARSHDYFVSEDLRVEDIMTMDPMTVAPNDNVRDAISMILRHRISCLPVVRDTELVGVLTDMDLLRLLGKLLNNH